MYADMDREDKNYNSPVVGIGKPFLRDGKKVSVEEEEGRRRLVVGLGRVRS